MRDYKGQHDEYVSAIQGLITAITAFWLIVYFLGRSFWNDLLQMKTHIVILMFLQIIATASLSLWAARERFEFKYKKLVLITVANTFFRLSLPIIGVLLSVPERGAEVRIVMQAFSEICICGCLYVYNFKCGKLFYSSKIWKEAFLFNFPLLPHYLSIIILNHSDRIMISKMVGNSETALYSVAYSGVMALSILATSMNHSFAPWLYGKIERKSYKNIASVANFMFVGMAIVLVLLIELLDELL